MMKSISSPIGLAVTAAVLISFGLAGCSDSDPATPVRVTDEGEVFIEDQTGKQWNVTYAVNELNFKVNDFNFGLGPDAIPPIVDPVFVLPGDPGYPAPDAAFRVLGMSTGEDHRAYAVTEIAGHEVVNDQIGELHFAATY